MAEARSNPRQSKIQVALKAIIEGDFDDHLMELHEAMETRKAELRAQVVSTVKSVFGPDYEVVQRGAAEDAPPALVQPPPRSQPLDQLPPPTTQPTASDIVADPLESIGSTKERDMEIESNSPVFGAAEAERIAREKGIT